LLNIENGRKGSPGRSRISAQSENLHLQFYTAEVIPPLSGFARWDPPLRPVERHGTAMFCGGFAVWL